MTIHMRMTILELKSLKQFDFEGENNKMLLSVRQSRQIKYFFFASTTFLVRTEIINIFQYKK